MRDNNEQAFRAGFREDGNEALMEIIEECLTEDEFAQLLDG
jgi:hypothetical protein